TLSRRRKLGRKLVRVLVRAELELGQMIADLEPGRLRADPEVGECPALWVVVEDAEAHAHDIGIGGAPAVDRGAASPAEGAKDARRRLELTEEVGTRGQRPVLPSHVGIRPESGAVRLATTRAVAIDDRAELSGDFDLDRTTEACRVHRLPPFSGCAPFRH